MTDQRISLLSKKYYSIDEVGQFLGVRASVLRYWEQEFSDLKPKRTLSGRRQYQKKDIDFASKIFDLLYRRRFTIAGARAELQILQKKRKNLKEGDGSSLRAIIYELETILESLRG